MVIAVFPAPNQLTCGKQSISTLLHKVATSDSLNDNEYVLECLIDVLLIVLFWGNFHTSPPHFIQFSCCSMLRPNCGAEKCNAFDRDDDDNDRFVVVWSRVEKPHDWCCGAQIHFLSASALVEKEING